ncbi:Hydroxyindole-O-methyltransferase [Handroanthus impetiginosus]|uniref:Hydroxyindole-O-methyltransferase n=1 Tax=Handroanthus impetiginosus TaxID=429701 RepID=A0A2G9GGN4_9LAMI|nr:Hydroxyindole-O-methyltransferase [Handroanthus impetiginosus]
MVLDEEAQAGADVLLRIAAELEIPDIVKNHGAPISLSDLSAAVEVPADKLYRIMRFLIHHRIFKKTERPESKVSNDVVYYTHTPLSLLLTMDNVGPFMLLQGGPDRMSRGIMEVLKSRNCPDCKTPNRESTWGDPGYATKEFTDAMACHATVATSVIIENCPEAFRGIGTLVDVGSRHGMALGMLIKAFPWIKGISFDLPVIVAKAPPVDGVQFVRGSMLETIPKADAIMLMWILHHWSDEACINILKKCKAVPADTGKAMFSKADQIGNRLIIVEAILNEEDEYTSARLSLDMIMMATMIEGKERTYKEWVHLLMAAGFSKHNVRDIKTLVSVIEAYP